MFLTKNHVLELNLTFLSFKLTFDNYTVHNVLYFFVFFNKIIININNSSVILYFTACVKYGSAEFLQACL